MLAKGDKLSTHNLLYYVASEEMGIEVEEYEHDEEFASVSIHATTGT